MYASLKRNVLRYLLKQSTEDEARMLSGSEFHRKGPALTKARSPDVCISHKQSHYNNMLFSRLEVKVWTTLIELAALCRSIERWFVRTFACGNGICEDLRFLLYMLIHMKLVNQTNPFMKMSSALSPGPNKLAEKSLISML